MTAKPLTPEEAAELAEEGLVVQIDGKPYNKEDLHRCSECRGHFVYASDLDCYGECEDCASESREAEDSRAELAADWRASRL